MGILMSGLIGALFATILNIFYLYLSEQKKIRAEVLLEVVAYCDDIYKNLQFLHTLKNAAYTDKIKELPQDDYQATNRELTALLTSSRAGVKLALVYGEGDVLALFNELRSWFKIVSSVLRGATPSNWPAEHEGIILKFSQQIDPLRASFETMLLQEARLPSITKQTFKTIFHTFCEYFRSKVA